MEKLRFVNREGVVVRLPPGFKFQPTDEELVFQYLRNKLFSLSLPAASMIPEICNIFNYDPWDLPGELEQERYFFSKKESKYRIGNRSNRTTPSGFWKASGSDRQILSSNTTSNGNNGMVGMKKTLVFYRGKPSRDSKTDWIMHEYRLVVNGGNTAFCMSSKGKNENNQTYSNQMENWVICRIFMKKRNPSDANEVIQTGTNDMREAPQIPRFYNFMMNETVRFRSDQMSSSCLSSSSSNGGITSELYSNGADSDLEESSSSYY